MGSYERNEPSPVRMRVCDCEYIMLTTVLQLASYMNTSQSDAGFFPTTAEKWVAMAALATPAPTPLNLTCQHKTQKITASTIII